MDLSRWHPGDAAGRGMDILSPNSVLSPLDDQTNSRKFLMQEVRTRRTDANS